MPNLTRLLTVASFSLALAGCATASGRVSALPPLKQYSKEWQSSLKAEMPKVRACCPKATDAIKDYYTLRKMIRAGNGVLAPKPQSGGVFGGLFTGK